MSHFDPLRAVMIPHAASASPAAGEPHSGVIPRSLRRRGISQCLEKARARSFASLRMTAKGPEWQRNGFFRSP